VTMSTKASSSPFKPKSQALRLTHPSTSKSKRHSIGVVICLAQLFLAIVIALYFMVLLMTVSSPTSSSPSSSSSSSSLSETIAYAVTITNCGSPLEADFQIAEGAAVLQYSVHRSSVHGNLGGRYDYKMYAIYHPEAKDCVGSLAELGYTLIERDSPVQVEEIKGKFLRERLPKSGCCGEKELIKFEAFTLTDHPAIVLLDLDVIIMKPLDDLFDWMLHGKRAPDHHLMWPNKPVTVTDIRLFYVTDYQMGVPDHEIKPVQGGFTIFRPDPRVLEEIKATVREGQYFDGSGWYNKTGMYWGSTTFQGLIPYYFFIKDPGHAVELHWCIHDNMASSPLDDDPERVGVCVTGEQTCEDCRKRPIADLYSAHFTNCKKPWFCLDHNQGVEHHPLCREMNHFWYQIRSEMEQSWGRSALGPYPNWKHGKHFFGFCQTQLHKGYIYIQKPYGKPMSVPNA